MDNTSHLFFYLFSNHVIVSNFMIKDGSKTGQGRRGYLEEGAWDAIHVIEVKCLCFQDHGLIKATAQRPLINWKNTSVLVFQLLVLISEILILLFNVNLGGTRRRRRHQLSVNQYSYVDFDYK